MGLANCRHCGHQVAKDAPRCPSCGGVPLFRLGCSGWLLVVLAAPIGIAMLNGDKNPAIKSPAAVSVPASAPAPAPEEQTPEQRREQAVLNARYLCREAVRESLHDPKSAEFLRWGDYAVEQTAETGLRVYVRLRARNGMNALRLATVICDVAPVDGKWMPVKLEQVVND